MLAEQIPVTIDCSGFDALTTCPPICWLNVPVFVQSVHDLIPLEFFAHNENQVMFSYRLQACAAGGRLFVSATARNSANGFCTLNCHRRGAKRHG